MKAALLLRADPHYRRDAFVAGLEACGYDILPMRAPSQRPLEVCDVFVCWGLGSGNHVLADMVRKRGAKVIVAENGYIGRDAQDRQLYAMALNGHNGSGQWPVGDEDRWSALGIEVKPYRAGGDHIVVFGQRGIGPPDMRSPPDWHRKVAHELAKWTKRKIVVSPHPGDPACSHGVVKQTLELLKGAHCCVTWASARGIRALVEGVPVIYKAPHWIGAQASYKGLDAVDDPPNYDRMPMLRRLAWAQWTAAEISSGIPFNRLLNVD